MTRGIDYGDHSIGQSEQRILLALQDAKLTIPELEDLTQLSYHKIHYRLDKKLIDVGLVREVFTTQERVFTLTEDGKWFIDEHDLDIATLDQLQAEVKSMREAFEDAEKASNRYSSQVYNLKEKVEALEDESNDGLREEFETLKENVEPPTEYTLDNAIKITDLQKEIRDIRSSLDSLDNFEQQIIEFEKELKKTVSIAESVQSKFRTVKQQHNRLSPRVTAVEKDIEEVKDRLDKIEGELADNSSKGFLGIGR